MNSARRDRWLSPDRAGVIRRAALAFTVATAITAGICTPVAIRAAEADGGPAMEQIRTVPSTDGAGTAHRGPHDEP